jgi:hypothetical protein
MLGRDLKLRCNATLLGFIVDRVMMTNDLQLKQRSSA